MNFWIQGSIVDNNKPKFLLGPNRDYLYETQHLSHCHSCNLDLCPQVHVSATPEICFRKSCTVCTLFSPRRGIYYFYNSCAWRILRLNFKAQKKLKNFLQAIKYYAQHNSTFKYIDKHIYHIICVCVCVSPV